jgi:putative CocE/NonD family hydrolase
MLPLKSIKVEFNCTVELRDGVVLYADVYRPDDEGKHPAVLVRTPYDKIFPQGYWYYDPPRVAQAGYAVVVQDCRGTGVSEGEFYAFRDEAEDGYDTVEWVAAQPWCDGNVGMYGLSYMGNTQWAAADARPPHLKTICPQMCKPHNRESFMPDGVICLFRFLQWWRSLRYWFVGPLSLAASRSKLPLEKLKSIRERLFNMLNNYEKQFAYLPLKDVPIIKEIGKIKAMGSSFYSFYFEFIDNMENDDFWKPFPSSDLSKVTVPCFHITGWYDHRLRDVLESYIEMKQRGGSEVARKNQKLLVGPWYHNGDMPSLIGQIDTGWASSGKRGIDVTGMHIRWFDRWLKGIDNGFTDEPPVRIFVMGDNVWRDENEWPLARTRYTAYYLHSNGHANTRFGDGVLSPKSPDSEEEVDIYLYDPRNPVPSTGGYSGSGCTDTRKVGVQDQREVEKRQDILVYTSEPLEADLEVTGPIEIKLWAASSAPDTDFTGKLVDVYPDGRAYNLAMGIVRARYRESVSKPKLIEPGKVYQYSINLSATSNVFRAGHRIRVDISSSNFPFCDRNLNTGNAIGQDAEIKVALQSVYHDKKHASQIILPVIPRG